MQNKWVDMFRGSSARSCPVSDFCEGEGWSFLRRDEETNLLLWQTPDGSIMAECPGNGNWLSSGSKFKKIHIEEERI